jgi:ParB family chromosome partitioning protein
MKSARGKQHQYGVCAGQRREAALDLLFKQKHIAADYPVPVRIVSEGEALAISLIENSEREGLDPFDVLRAYRMLAEEGRSVDYIAALFSASPITVKRRMKLANVSPKLLALLREDAITLDQLGALALADDHETQELAWFNTNAWQRQPHYLRQALTHAEIDASRDRLVRFIGLDAYEAAGGYVRRDLFSDDENAGYIADAKLLQRLVANKLATVTEELRAEGWDWIETRIERDRVELNRYGRLRPIQRPYTADEQRKIDAFIAQRDELADKVESLSEEDENADDEAERLDTEIERVNAAIFALENCAMAWDKQQMAEAGAFAIIGPQGELLIERGLVRREHRAALEAAGASVTGTPHAQASQLTDETDNPTKKEKPIHSAKLCQRLTAHRTAAIHAELIAHPAIALAALLQQWIPHVLPEHYGHTCARSYLALSSENNHDDLLRAADDLPASPAWNAIEAQRTRWIAALPAKQTDLLPWLIEQDPGTTLLDLLAFCIGSVLNGIAKDEKPQAINALAGALNLDMTRYWTPTRATYFDHVSKARIGEIVSAAVSPKAAADLAKMKKADAAAAAELRLAKIAWLPEIFTDREVPAMPSWNIQNDEDEEKDEDEDNPDKDKTEDAGSENSNEAHAEPDATNGSRPINNTHRHTEASDTTTSELVPWPFPTTASENTMQAKRHLA